MKIKEKILLIEDERTIRGFMQAILTANGYDVLMAGTGAMANTMISSHCPDLIILDLGLPDMDGMTILRSVREWSKVPILVVSARSHERDKVEALDAGADDYLTKPFSVDELLARVRANLRRSSMASSESTEASTFDNGPLHIDYAAGYATKDGRELSLTPTEYKLLVLLAKNVDKVLTHTFITREIWGTSWDSDLASLRVFMRTLRKKIEADPSHPKMIQTHMGVGYRMQRL